MVFPAFMFAVALLLIELLPAVLLEVSDSNPIASVAVNQVVTVRSRDPKLLLIISFTNKIRSPLEMAFLEVEVGQSASGLLLLGQK